MSLEAELSPDQIQAAIEWLKQAWHVGGWWCVTAGAVMMAIRLWRSDFAQGLIAPRVPVLAWEGMGSGKKTAISFLSAFAGAVATAALAGVGWQAALIAALPVGLGAIGLHHGTEIAGAVLDWLLTKIRGPQYVPGSLRKAVVLVLPTVLPSANVPDQKPPSQPPTPPPSAPK